MMNQKSISKIGGLILIISVVCLLLGCPNASSPSKPSNVTEGTIEYGDEVFSCKEGYSIFLPSGSKVKVGSFLSCQTKRPIGQAVEYWYINGTKLEDSESQVIINHIVKTSDFVDGKLKLAVKFRTPETAKLELDTLVSCRTLHANKSTGDDIIESEELSFEAQKVSDRAVEYWYVNDVKIESSESLFDFSYTPKRSDFVDGKFKIHAMFKEKTKGTLEFDNKIKGAFYDDNGWSIPVVSGSEAEEGVEYSFMVNLPEGTVVKHWYINGNKLEGIPYSPKSLLHFMKRSDFVDGKIKVSFDTRDAVKGTIEFDNETVSCSVIEFIGSSNNKKLKSGDQMYGWDLFEFGAIVPQGKVVESWYINDLKIVNSKYNGWITPVRDADIIGGKVKIKVVFKDE